MSRPQFPKGVPVPDWPPSAPEDRRGWSEDWQIGDLAECLISKEEWPDQSKPHPDKGEILRVNAMGEGLTNCGSKLISGLGFEGRPVGVFWAQQCFRKLRPEVAAADAEFSAWLRDSRKVRP